MSRPKITFPQLLKIALFATGLSGIVAEYILATLATYFLGNATLQWTLILSVMLFAMGLGSRWSQRMEGSLLRNFLLAEFGLSVLTSFSALLVYVTTPFWSGTQILIYSLAVGIGLLIGLEIPLVTRLNSQYELLKENISNVMANDYYGSLAGGLFFAFVGLPYLGLTYTPFVLGWINFSVAAILFWRLADKIPTSSRRGLVSAGALVALGLLAGILFAKPIIRYGEQARYADKVIYEEQSRYQKLVITQWKNHYWLYLNGNLQLSTLDEALYHEPLVHPAMLLHGHPQRVLVLGGGDGFAVRELLKYPSVEQITLVDLDPAMTQLGLTHPAMTLHNGRSLEDPRVEVINQDGFTYMEASLDFFDVILVDLPDPKSTDLARLYSQEMYRLCARHLTPHGVLVTQAGSPYYATQAFRCIEATMASSGLAIVPLHNQVLSLGEWGWILGQKGATTGTEVKQRLQRITLPDSIPFRWLTQDALMAITLFGKDLLPVDSVSINTIQEPVLHRYYLQGNWELY
ncbi:MAG TPA: polyamine aminopropyltransferase [Cytophagales bacterium]|nr:polyamine aminopropyltransferase [Cytophagales bacterium]HAA17640.1 polyamine aminopropyltransferase [Cytophagales bacterium]HAP63943.1 polyamine aminopropyltransferase [Cytophagales bacterium]